MLSVRCIRSSGVAWPGCRRLSASAQVSAGSTEQTDDPASADGATRPLNILGEPEGLSEQEITAKRNIARMSARMHNRNVKGVYMWNHSGDFKDRQLRADYVKFGAATGINAGVCWPTKQEMADLHLLDKDFNPTFAQLKERFETKKKESAEQIAARENDLDANLAKLAMWRKEMLDKEAAKEKKEAERKAVMAERIREVREYIGYNVQPSDPKFIEVMEMKDAERKAAAKEAKKLAKKQKIMEKLMNVGGAAAAATEGDASKSPKTAETPADNAAGVASETGGDNNNSKTG